MCSSISIKLMSSKDGNKLLFEWEKILLNRLLCLNYQIKYKCSTRFSNNPNSFVTMDKNSNFMQTCKYANMASRGSVQLLGI